ncbi:RHS repeat-associated protein [Streptacidiphilus sp. MAP12-33]|uniref:polymorphic toxin type 28 domain-containing protein n=1 Tax=Streptacidiphilus sp. MAP12-33 TaxID=3156266 RepID=UPI0035180F8F
MSGQIAHAVAETARKAGQGLAHDFSAAYHRILKDTEEKTAKVAEHAAENEARTVEGLGKAAERGDGGLHEPHAGGGHEGGHQGDGAGGPGREQVHDPHDPGRPPESRCGGGEPVDMATGRMYIDQTDAALPGTLPLAFTRGYESGYRAGRWFGPRWTSTFDERLEIDGEGVVHLRADRVTQAYPHPEPGRPAVLPTAGEQHQLGVDARGRAYTLSERASGLTREFTLQPDGTTALLTRVRNRSGDSYTLEYDHEGAPAAIAHSGGYRLLVEVASGRITALSLAGAAADGGDQPLVRYAYAGGNLTEVRNSSGLPMRFAYDAWDRITSWTDRNDSSYHYVYDVLGRVVDEGGATGALRFTFRYGAPDPATGLRLHTETNALGHTTTYEVNERLQITAITDPLGHVTRFERDAHDRLLSRTDPLGRRTSRGYDAAGDLLWVEQADGTRSTAAYGTALPQPTELVDADGAVWRQRYDETGLRTALTDPLGATTAYTYDERGHLAGVTDTLGRTTRVVCDAAGLPVEVADPLGAVTSMRRDAFGRVVEVTDPLGGTIGLEWTVEGYLARRTAADGSHEGWTYDGEGNRTGHTDALGRTTRYEYTHFETLAARTTPDGARVTFTHDAHMQLVGVTDALGRTWSYRYDEAGRLVGESDFDGREIGYVLDAAGQGTRIARPDGRVLHYRYDALGQVTAKEVEGVTTVYAYDRAGRLREAASPSSGRLSRTFDAAGRLLTETTDGRTLVHDYDALGRPARRVTPRGHVTTWSYDAADRPVRVDCTGGSLDFAYDAAGRELRRVLGGTLTLTSDWDARHRLTARTLTAAESDRPLQRRRWAWRADDRLVGVTDQTGGAREFDLDPAGRVTAVRAEGWNERYAYNGAGDLTEASWPTTDATRAAEGPRAYAGTELLTAGRVRYEHDTAGRVTLRQVTRLSRTPDTWRYRWNAEDQLTEVTTPDGTVWQYRYDPLGRRSAKLRLADDGASVAERTEFTWDGAVLCEQTTEAGYLPGPHSLAWDHDGFTPLAQTETITAQERTDRRFFAIVTDLVGTPTELVDPVTQAVAWRATSTLWGNTTWPAGSAGYTPLRFPGQYFDPESRLHYNLNRYYDPETARYTSPDPLGLLPGPNPNSYVGNPHTWTDPLGLSPHEETPSELSDEARQAITKYHNLMKDPIGEANSVPGHNHYSAARREANGEVVARRADGRPFSHISDLQQARDGMLGVHKTLTRQLMRGGEGMSQETRDLLSGYARRSNIAAGRLTSFLKQIGHGETPPYHEWPPGS